MTTITKLRRAVKADRYDVVRKLLRPMSCSNRSSAIRMINNWRKV